MSTRLTSTQVQEQKARFEAFMSSANLKKIGERILYYMANNNQDGKYNDYMYVRRVLGQIAKVEGSYQHPNSTRCYADILTHDALSSHIDSIN